MDAHGRLSIYYVPAPRLGSERLRAMVLGTGETGGIIHGPCTWGRLDRHLAGTHTHRQRYEQSTEGKRDGRGWFGQGRGRRMGTWESFGERMWLTWALEEDVTVRCPRSSG